LNDYCEGMRLSNLLRSLPAGKTLNERKDRIVSARLQHVANQALTGTVAGPIWLANRIFELSG
jgi:hypothetical protein